MVRRVLKTTRAHALHRPAAAAPVPVVLLMLGCSLRELDELEGEATPARAMSIALDGGACLHDSECGDGRCREELGRCELCPIDMRLVRLANGQAFCIEAREVSRADYSLFLETVAIDAASALALPVMCEGKTRFDPGGGTDCRAEYQADEARSLPITCVDLCDAMAYCSSLGRRLCGGSGGVRIGPRRVDTPVDEWQSACSAGGSRAFPYGDAFEPVCNIGGSRLVEVEARPECSTPDGITQLNGNVAEWVMQCRNRSGLEECLVRGGEYRTQDLAVASCWMPPEGVDAAVPPMLLRPLERSPGVGIRCCAD